MNRIVITVCVLAATALMLAVDSSPAQASTSPVVSGLSIHHGPYWGETVITVHGQNFTHLRTVLFGGTKGGHVHVLSPTALTVITPEHGYGTVNVRVVTAAGRSAKTPADTFVFRRPTMDTPIQGGLTATQEQRASAVVRAHHRTPRTAKRAAGWTAAMGLTAVRRAASWIGLPYSWAGGDVRGPTAGVCAHNGGDLDCRIVGFDCSGLALYSWAPYRTLVHYAATQYNRAGRFHPTIGQLMPGDLVFFSGYIADGIGHVAVYAGRGLVVEAAQSGTLVRRSRLTDVIADNGVYRGATRPMSTGRQGTGPRVTAATPTLSTAGGTVTITGSGLGSATSVSVGSSTIYSLARSAGRLVVTLPAHQAGQVPVVVSNAWGSATSSVAYVAPPHARTLTPSSGPASGGTAVVVTGSGLGTVTRVTVGATTVGFRIVSATQLSLTTPAHDPGATAVTLYSAYGASSPLTFTYTANPSPLPTLTAPPLPARSSPAAGSATPGAPVPVGTPAGTPAGTG